MADRVLDLTYVIGANAAGTGGRVYGKGTPERSIPDDDREQIPAERFVNPETGMADELSDEEAERRSTLEGLTVDELHELARAEGIHLGGVSRKADIIEVLREAGVGPE